MLSKNRDCDRICDFTVDFTKSVQKQLFSAFSEAIRVSASLNT